MEHQCEVTGGLVVKDGHIVLLRDSGSLSEDDQRAMDILTGVYLLLPQEKFQNILVGMTRRHRNKMT